jgi:hypothetical protein
MDSMQKPNPLKQLLQQKIAAQKAGGGSASILKDADLARQFGTGAKPQRRIRRGGRNGSGKP